jgi:hypothetical protein
MDNAAVLSAHCQQQQLQPMLMLMLAPVLVPAALGILHNQFSSALAPLPDTLSAAAAAAAADGDVACASGLRKLHVFVAELMYLVSQTNPADSNREPMSQAM